MSFSISCIVRGWYCAALFVIMRTPSNLVVIHRWNAFMATADIEIRWRHISARSPRGPPRLRRTVSFAPQTRRIRLGVSASAPVRSRVHQARDRVRDKRSPSLLWYATGWRFVITAKSFSSMLRKGLSICLNPCACDCLFGPNVELCVSRPRTRRAKSWNSLVVILQLCPVSLSSSVLPRGDPPSPTVDEVVVAANACVRSTRLSWKK